MSHSNDYWSRFWRQRYSRRRALATGGAGAAGLAGLALVGCGDDDDDDGSGNGGSPTPGSGNGDPSPSATQGSGDVQTGGTYVSSQVTSLRDVFDPHTSLYQAALVYAMVGNLAVRGNADFTELQGELVESWETPGDGTEIMLSVRPGVVWQDKPPTAGRALTADDIAFNLMRIAGKLDPENPAAYQRRSTLPNLENAEAVDDSTVRITLTAPHSGFINGLGDWRNTIIPQDFAESTDFSNPADAIGTGPWMIESFNNEVSARFVPNPTFFEEGQPYMEAFEWVWIPDLTASYASFAQGNVSQVAGNTPVARQTINQTAGNAQEYRWVQGQWTHFRFNTQREQFQDPQVRRAIQLALDYQTMNNAAYGDGYWNHAGALSIAFPEALGSDEISGRQAFNPDEREAAIAESRSLMEAAGYPNGEMTISIMPFQPTGDFFDRAIRAQDDLGEVWPDMNVTVDPPADTTTFSQRQIGGDFDLISYQLFPAPDAVLEMETNFRTDGSRNYGKFSDPDVDAAITAASMELDLDARGEILREAQEALVDEQVPLIISGIPDQVVFFQEDLRNFENSGRRAGGGNYDLAYESRRFWIDQDA